MAGEVVRLNVYDLLDVNKVCVRHGRTGPQSRREAAAATDTPRTQHVSCVGLGVYHSGVEVYGKEYAYGGHEFRCGTQPQADCELCGPRQGTSRLGPRDIDCLSARRLLTLVVCAASRPFHV